MSFFEAHHLTLRPEETKKYGFFERALETLWYLDGQADKFKNRAMHLSSDIQPFQGNSSTSHMSTRRRDSFACPLLVRFLCYLFLSGFRKFTKMKPAEITQPDLTKYLAYCFTMLESPLLATPKWQPFQSLLLTLTKSMQPYLEYLKKHAVTQSLHQQRETPSPNFQDDVTMRILPHVPSATAHALRKETKTCSNLQLKSFY